MSQWLKDELKDSQRIVHLNNGEVIVDEEEFYNLDVSKIEKLSELYHSTNVSLLAKFLRRNKNE